MTNNAAPATHAPVYFAAMSKQDDDMVVCLFDDGIRKKLPRAAAYNSQLRVSLGFTPVEEIMPPMRVSAVDVAAVTASFNDPGLGEQLEEETPQVTPQVQQAPKRGPGRPKASTNAH